MLPSEIPKDKRVKYSGVIINDRHYAKNAPLWTAQVLRIRHAFFIILIYLIRVVVV